MRAVLSFFRAGMSWTELAILAWHGGEYRTPQALFWDYASLYQKDEKGNKTDEEKKAFGKALKVMTFLYATPNALVLQHKALPPGFSKEQPTYDESGW